MIATRSRTWWQSFSAAGVLFALSCSSESITPQVGFEDDEPGALAGELTVYIANYDDGTADTRYFLKVGEGDERRLHFSNEPEIAPGTRVKIWGTQRADKLDVAKYRVATDIGREGIGSAQQALAPLVDAAVKPDRVLCAALVNISSSGTPKSTVAAIKNNFHTSATSANAYYRENSFGQVGLGGDSYGPFSYPMTSCDYSALASNIKPMLNMQSPVKCNQYAFIFGPQLGACGWSGLGQVGSSDKPASDTWYNDSISCVVAVQEPGHNYGMQHSSSITCSGGTGGFADDLSGCTHSEYGDKYDTMGGGCYHMNAWQKLYQKWFGGCNAVKVTSSGKFNLYPIENPCNGVQVLQLPFPGGKTRSFQSTTLTSYYLELRTATGFDSKYGNPSVLLHAGAAPILPNTTNPTGKKTWVIATGGSSQWGLLAGKTWSDPAGGLTITVESVSTTGAVIDVNYTSGSGQPVCLDGNNTPFVPPGPTDCTAPPTIGDASPPPPPTDARTDTGTGGTGGTGGTADAAGGTAGTAGTGGAPPGAGGTAGKAGAGGTGGAGGAGAGGSGVGGTGGVTGGAAGSGGDSGATGGDGGRAGSRPPANPEDLSGGCGCRVPGSEPVGGARSGALAILGLAGLFARRRRRS
jgi:MYXO-CTERM domain-containing protein